MIQTRTARTEPRKHVSQVFRNGREKRQKKNAYRFSQTLQKEQNAWRQIKRKGGGGRSGGRV